MREEGTNKQIKLYIIHKNVISSIEKNKAGKKNREYPNGEVLDG